MLKNLRKIFTKVKAEKTIDNSNIHNLQDDIKETEVFADKREAMPKEDGEAISANSDKEVSNHNIVRTRLNAYVVKNKEEDFRLMDYNMDTGEVVWIEGKLFNNLRGLKRVRWSPTSSSSTVYYGYISKEQNGEKLVSSVYIMNIIQDMIKNNSLGEIVYNIKDGTITINHKDNSIIDNAKVFYIFSVSSVVEMEMLLTKINLSLNRE